MAFEQLQPCPPGPVKDYKNDSRYKNEANFMGMHFSCPTMNEHWKYQEVKNFISEAVFLRNAASYIFVFNDADVFRTLYKDMYAVHPVEADRPDECELQFTK